MWTVFLHTFIKGVTGVEVTSEEIKLNHINVYRKVKGRNEWSDISMTLYTTLLLLPEHRQ
jgi:hypothetical protein